MRMDRENVEQDSMLARHFSEKLSEFSAI